MAAGGQSSKLMDVIFYSKHKAKKVTGKRGESPLSKSPTPCEVLPPARLYLLRVP